MDLTATFQSTVTYLESGVYWLVLSYLLLSEFGTPIPLPGNMVLIAGGFLIGRAGDLPLWLIGGSVLATLPGATVLYWLGRRGGEPLLRRIGPRIGLTDDRRQRIRAQLERRAVLGLVIIRVLPTVRVGTTLLPGAIGLPWPNYALGMGTALTVWVTVYIGAGYGLARWGTAGLIALPVLVLAVGGFALWRKQRVAA